MFKTLIYFDSKKVMEYKSLIERKKAINLKSIKVSNEKSGKVQIPILSGDVFGKSEMDGEILENYLLDCEEFEDLIESTEYYFDFLEPNSQDYDIETIQKSSIIKFEGTFYVPSQFDMLHLIDKFRPLLISSINTESNVEEELLKSFLGKKSTKIPIFIENELDFNNRLGFAKINSNSLCCEIDDLEEFENEDVKIIAKLISRKDIKKEPIVVFDVAKDLFSMGRALRRQIGESGIEGVENISIDEDFMTLEILAIYI